MSVNRKLWSIGGGKGGIGKSVFTLGLGISLANLGQRIILVDADLGGANLHTLMGVRYPAYTLEDFLLKRVSRLEDIIIETGVKGIGLICGADDILGAANPTYSQKVRLLSQIEDLPADLVLLDLGAGTSFNTLDFFNYSPGKICLITSQATSLQNGYGFIKSSVYRHLSRVFAKEEELLELLWQTDHKDGGEDISSLKDIETHLQGTNPGLHARLVRVLEDYQLHLVVNMVKKERDLQAALIIREVTSSFLGLTPRILGHIAFDLAVEAAVNLMIPFPLDKDYSQAAEDMRSLAAQVLELARQPVALAAPASSQTEEELTAGVWNPQWQRLPA